MSDPFTLAAQTAAAALGLQPAVERGELTKEEFAEFAGTADLGGVRDRMLELARGGVQVFAFDEVVSADVRVRAVLRRDLGFHAYEGCLAPLPSRVRGCRCGEDAVREVAARVQDVDASVVVAARARAEVLHGRLSRRLGRARVRAARVLRGSVGSRAPVVASVGRRRLGLETIGIADGSVVPVRDVASASAVATARGASGRAWSSAAGVRVGNVDAEGRALAAKLGVDYSVTGWKALPTVDGKRAES